MDESDGLSFGGFFPKNIKKWIIKECLESGDPENFFLCIEDAVNRIGFEIEDDPDYWDKAGADV